MYQTELLAIVSVGIVILGFVNMPLLDVVVKDVSFVPIPAMKWAQGGTPGLWIYPLFAVFVLFFINRKGGSWIWLWILAGAIGIIALVSGGLGIMNNITVLASKGFLGANSLEDILMRGMGGFPQIIEKLTFGTGFYVSMIGLILLVASGVWEMIQYYRSHVATSTTN